MSFDNIPNELKEVNQWIAWKLMQRPGAKKPTKVPIDPHTGRLASVTDPTTWGTFEQARNAAKQYTGIGFVFSEGDPYCGIDIDGQIDNELIEWMDSYTEYSYSGNGAHIICKAVVGSGHKRDPYEIYDRKRYFVFTGRVIADKPVEERQEKVNQFIVSAFEDIDDREVDLSGWIGKPKDDIFERISKSAQGEKFNQLWRGDWKQAGYDSQSNADAALLSILRFWTGGNKEESFRLFGLSELGKRNKWTSREYYRERTWKLIDNGDVYTEYRPEPPSFSATIERKLSPWREVTDRQIERLIEGTALQPLVELFQSPMNPKLPIQASLIKSIVLAGCALCGKSENITAFQGAASRGIDLAKFKINTARGQACNIYGLLVAKSGSGKDIGGLIDHIALQRGWLIGNSGSAEGLADTLSEPGRGNGFIAISEFSDWLDKRGWQSKAAPFLTSAFNRGWFAMRLSNRNGTTPRESNYCFPSILANVQPEALQKYANTIDISTGFLSRFLITRMPDTYFGRPACRDYDQLIMAAQEAIDCYTAKEGSIDIGDGYLDELCQQFLDCGAGISSHWGRLVNEYGPRFAVMLSTTDNAPQVTLTQDSWRGAELLIQWLYSMAEGLLSEIQEDEQISKRERLLKRVFDAIKKLGGECEFWKITNKVQRGTTIKERRDAIDELIDRGIVERENDNGKNVIRILTTPEGWE